jgi:hypothetical protein
VSLVDIVADLLHPLFGEIAAFSTVRFGGEIGRISRKRGVVCDISDSRYTAIRKANTIVVV